jgi:hypothetical protein
VTGVFVVTVTGQRVDAYDWVPARMVDRQPVPMVSPEVEGARADWDRLRACTDLTP